MSLRKFQMSWKKINQSQYFHLALCIQIWKIWTFSNTFRLKKKKRILSLTQTKIHTKDWRHAGIPDFCSSTSSQRTRWLGPILLFHRRNIKEDWRLELPGPAWIARTPQPHAEACPRGECRAQHLDEELLSCGDLKSHILILPFPSVNLHRKCLYTQGLRWVVKMTV